MYLLDINMENQELHNAHQTAKSLDAMHVSSAVGICGISTL